MPRPSLSPAGVGSAWAPKTRRAPRGPQSLTRDAVVEAAVSILDREGLQGLSMRRLAAEVDAGVTTLYWHVAHKEEILDLVCDHVLGELELPGVEVDDWKQRLIVILGSLRTVLLRHRDLATLLATRANVGPNALRVRELIAQSLHDAGLPVTLMSVADSALLSYTVGFAASEAAHLAREEEMGDDPYAADSDAATFLAQLPEDRYPGLVAMARVPVEMTFDERFHYGLRAMLAGIASDLQP